MIKRLVLESFGKFRNRDFAFGPVTLFFGPNEAGKTTVFDAVFDGISAPKGTIEAGKRLRDRYGPDRKARLEFDGEPVSIPAPDFLNLFAVQAGKISFDIDKNSEWMNRVKAELFSGGVSPAVVAQKLDGKLKSRTKDSLRAEIERLELELGATRDALRAARGEREVCLADEKRIASLDERRRSAQEEIEALAAETKTLREDIDRQRNLREAKSVENLLALFPERKRLAEDLERYGRYSGETLEELKRMEADRQKLKSEADRCEASLQAAEEKLGDLLDEKAEAEAEKTKLEKAGIAASMLKKGLLDRERLVDRKTTRSFRPPLLAAAAVALAAGLVLFFLAPPAASLFAFVASTAAGLVLFFLSMRKETREDFSRLEAALRDVREAWKRETGGDLGEGGYEAVLVALDRAAERAARAASLFEKVRDRAAEQEKAAADRRAELRRAQDAVLDAERGIRRVLERAGAADREEYAARLQKREFLEKRLEAIDAALGAARLRYGAASDADLEGRASRKLAELAAVPAADEAGEAEFRALERAFAEKTARLESLRSDERAALGDLGLNRGSLRERFKGLPERIAGLERAEAEGVRLLAERRNSMKAIELARDIFASLTGDDGAMLSELSREIGATFSRVLAMERNVVFESFDAEEAAVTDAGGGARRENQLSSGTRDAFLLAARLVLARKSPAGPGGGLVVLDEPFLALDRPRTRKALEVLDEFRSNAGWQIVLFTKDEALAEDARKVFGGTLTVHDLG